MPAFPTHYLVPARLTPEQTTDFFDALAYDIDWGGNQVPEGANAMIRAVGTPIVLCTLLDAATGAALDVGETA
ncbi:hypothetical protein CFR78_04365 [Komagataeibacter rhaeticus]|uniref:hypothetical protein n=1 Tax=Komagataeibacter rhaeticus TaxID=215221 RepID=UPI0004DA6BE6|nr:hypothetical protein [Komagataeibacter rhaeticus]KDU96482.1 hypothetical protein GLUCORHAEAF1_01840 [Komagataeibacter rhaeticus AF1]PYD54209.1 hypothetical protein CFR78_04365 [Komagataeibacter rhaeticus]GBQ15163.1 hypothetical protein AA16663_2007 [Komagataeibacter rhaeticus DSM 16663]